MLTRLVEGADAGIREGDVIEQINQKRVKSVADVRNELQRSGSNPLLLLINRRGTTIFLM
jgi:membrane-associated protease RseP (regulator of RpoE activity)